MESDFTVTLIFNTRFHMVADTRPRGVGGEEREEWSDVLSFEIPKGQNI